MRCIFKNEGFPVCTLMLSSKTVSEAVQEAERAGIHDITFTDFEIWTGDHKLYNRSVRTSQAA